MNSLLSCGASAGATVAMLLAGQAAAQITPGPLNTTADVIFVMDTSDSITTDERRRMTEAMSMSIGTLIPASGQFRVGVVGFSTVGATLLDLTFATTPSLAGDLLDLNNTTMLVGDTDLSAGLEAARDMIAADSRARWRHVVIFTDAERVQFGDSLAVAAELRAVYNARVSIGYLEDQCARYRFYECDEFRSPLARTYLDLGRFANAPVLLPKADPADPDLYQAPSGPLLPGVLACILEEAEDDAFLAEALCPLPLYGLTILDANMNEIPDPCDLPFDCDRNGVDDLLDPDCDADGIPDACEPDCDGDGIPDDCDPDIDGDGIPNENDPVSGTCIVEPPCDPILIDF